VAMVVVPVRAVGFLTRTSLRGVASPLSFAAGDPDVADMSDVDEDWNCVLLLHEIGHALPIDHGDIPGTVL